MKEKTPLSYEVVCFLMLDFETTSSKSEVSKSNTWKIASFSKTNVRHFSGSRFTQCFIQSTSPHYLLSSKFLCQQFCFSNYQQCLLPLISGLGKSEVPYTKTFGCEPSQDEIGSQCLVKSFACSIFTLYRHWTRLIIANPVFFSLSASQH